MAHSEIFLLEDLVSGNYHARILVCHWQASVEWMLFPSAAGIFWLRA